MGLITSKDTDGNVDFAADFHLPASNKALIVFTRKPELGKCKTRLAASIGDEAALKVYKFLLKHTETVTRHVTADKFVYYAGAVVQKDDWDPEVFRKKLQTEGDLGTKMYHAFLELFELGYQKVIIVGSDLYDLTTTEIDQAFSALNEHDIVLGPASDGGYYLLGMKTMHTEVFRNKEWGTASVLKETLADLRKNSVYTLKEKNDVDVLEDIKDVGAFQEFLPKELLKKTK
jgi:rSAM/selenodomain-associated transferase 1